MTLLWRKMWRDLLSGRARTALVVLSTAVGVGVLGVIFGAYGLMSAALESDRRAWIPIHVTLWGPFDREAEEAVRRETGVSDVQRQIETSFDWRLEGEVDWHEGRVVARQDYGTQHMGLIHLLDGAWPQNRTLAVESMTSDCFGVRPGAVVIVRTGQHERRLPVVGIVRDPDAGMPPQFGGRTRFFATPETATWLTGEDYNRLDVRIDPPGEDHADEVVDRLRVRLDGLGRTVGGAWIRNPDEHWFQDPLDTLLLILTLSGGLALLLSVFLIVNTMNAIVAQQVWQIGVMKAVGATRVRVLGTYLSIGLVYGALALCLALPLGSAGAHWLAAWALDMLNVSIGSFRVVPSALGVQVGTGIAVPLLAAALPASRGARVTVHGAIRSYGLGGRFGSGPLDRLVGRVRSLPRPVMLGLRNAFRRKARVSLTLTALSLGGAFFIAISSVEASCDRTIDRLVDDLGADVTVRFARSYRVERLLAVTVQVPGVDEAEVWKRWTGRLKPGDGRERSLSLVGLPPRSAILRPRVVSGRELVAGDGNAILLNHKVAIEEDIGPGDEVRIDLLDRETVWKVVGLVLDAEERSFVPFDALSGETDTRNRGWEVAVVSARHDGPAQHCLADELRARYAAQRLEADRLTSASQSEERVRSRFDVVVGVLLVVSLLAAGVGGIGLMGTMSINVIERRREIGVMRAMGASSIAIAAIFVAEGVMMGSLSWLLAVPMSYPAARLFSGLVGETLLRFPLDFVLSPGGVGLWLVGAIAISALASLWPALRATRSSVRETLAYE